MTAVFYLDPLEFIQKREFNMVVPSFYHPHVDRAEMELPRFKRQRPNRFTKTPMRSLHPTHFHQNQSPDLPQRAAYSIEVMVDMHLKKIEFELIDQADVVEILDGIDRYLLSRTEFVRTGDEATIAYIKMMLPFRSQVYQHYFRYMNTHPDALDRLYPNDSAKGNLLSIMALTSGSRNDERDIKLDPLRAKSKPPYEIEDLMPKSPIEKEEEFDGMAAGLGLGTANLLKDDGTFDFHEFLGSTK